MRNEDLHSRRALITGGAGGIGYAVARALLEAGARVAIGDLRPEALDHAARSLNNPQLLFLGLDVTSAESVAEAVRRCVERFGGLDTLVNCAGIISFAPLEEMRQEDWDRLLAVDLTGVFLCCRAAAPYLRRSGCGRIVTISSDAGKIG